MTRRLIAVTLALLAVPMAQTSAKECSAFLDHEVRKLRSSEQINLCSGFAGRPLLALTTAYHLGIEVWRFSACRRMTSGRLLETKRPLRAFAMLTTASPSPCFRSRRCLDPEPIRFSKN